MAGSPREAGFDNVWIQPAAGDDGIAIGCAYYGWLEILKQRRTFVMDHSYVGKPYTDEDVAAALQKFLVRIQIDAKRSDNICRDTAKLLAEQRVIGWFQGGSEFGPRALGNRSLLGRSAQARDEGYPEQPRQAPPGVPPVRADRAGRAGEGDFRGRGGFAVHADRQAGAPRMARQDSGDRACRRHRARADRARSKPIRCSIGC